MALAYDFVGKTFYANKDIKCYQLPSEKSELFDRHPTIKKGGLVGVVDTWVIRDGAIWWAFYAYNPSDVYYVKHETGAFSLTKEQQKQVENAEKSRSETGWELGFLNLPDFGIFTDALSGFGKLLITGVVLWGGLKIGSALIQNYRKKG